jgi:hypothetical protein
LGHGLAGGVDGDEPGNAVGKEPLQCLDFRAETNCRPGHLVGPHVFLHVKLVAIVTHHDDLELIAVAPLQFVIPVHQLWREFAGMSGPHRGMVKSENPDIRNIAGRHWNKLVAIQLHQVAIEDFGHFSAGGVHSGNFAAMLRERRGGGGIFGQGLGGLGLLGRLPLLLRHRLFRRNRELGRAHRFDQFFAGATLFERLNRRRVNRCHQSALLNLGDDIRVRRPLPDEKLQLL